MKTNRIIVITIYLIFVISINIKGQGLTIAPNAVFTLGNGSTFSFTGNWNNQGTFIPNTGTVKFIGGSELQTILKSDGETFYNITVNKSSGYVKAINNLTVNKTITLTKGRFDLNSNTLSLDTTGKLSETSGNIVYGGIITATATLNNPGSYNIGGLGAVITTTSNLGVTNITRGSVILKIKNNSNNTDIFGNSVQNREENSSISRYFDIQPTTNTALNASLVFKYDPSELNDITESSLQLFKSIDSGINWTKEVGELDIRNHTITISGITGFSRWTAAGTGKSSPGVSANVNAVEITNYFSATINNSKVTLKWNLPIEPTDSGFEVERIVIGPEGEEWQKIGHVNQQPNDSHNNYSFRDEIKIEGTKFNYRLKLKDNLGKFVYSDILNVSLNPPEKAELIQKKFRRNQYSSTMMQFFLPNTTDVSVKVVKQGKIINKLIQKQASAGYHIIYWNGKDFQGRQTEKGIYFYFISPEGQEPFILRKRK